MARLLLVDSDPAHVTAQVRQAFAATELTIQVSHTGAEGLARLRLGSPDVVLLEMRLSDRSGLEVFREIRRINLSVPVIFVSGAKTADAAIEAMQLGAYDYLFKPLDMGQLRRVVSEALEVSRRMREPTVFAEAGTESEADGSILGGCPAMREVYKAIGRVAGQDVPVLITGESGTGKELVALAIYQHGPRAKAPFLALNCAAIPENLLESELFGHEKGAFTGADRRRIGKFEQCTGGTIFLDEVGDMPLALQAKVLRLMQDQSFERVGGGETIHTDVRVVAATHRDLKAYSAEGKFRPDLYYRLGVFSIHLPPLRDRGDDLPLLVQLFLRRFSRELGREVRDVDPEAMERLCNYSWPGNVRELQSVLKQALLRASGPVLLSAFLPDDLIPNPRVTNSNGGPVWHRPGITLSELEREAIQDCLLRTGGNRQRTAELLGISTRTLLRKIRTYGMEDPLRSSLVGDKLRHRLPGDKHEVLQNGVHTDSTSKLR